MAKKIRSSKEFYSTYNELRKNIITEIGLYVTVLQEKRKLPIYIGSALQRYTIDEKRLLLSEDGEILDITDLRFIDLVKILEKLEIST